MGGLLVNPAVFFVSRQSYWPDGENVVEIAQGGINYANPDMLCSKYPGEGEEYIGLAAAVPVAFDVARRWKADGGKRVMVALGCTGGNTVPFEDGTTPSKKHEAVLLRFAQAHDEKLPHCTGGEVIPGKLWRLADDWTDADFCSEYCANRAAEFYEEQMS
jgi:hypothetical protein